MSRQDVYILTNNERKLYCYFRILYCIFRKFVLQYKQFQQMAGVIFVKISEMQNQTQNTPVPDQPRRVSDLLRELSPRNVDFYQELEMDSSFADTYRDITYPGDTVRLHVHNFYELLCCTNSCGAEYLVGSQRFRLQKGDVIFISPGISHCPLLPQGMTEPYVRDVLWLSRDFWDSMMQQFRQNHSGEPAPFVLTRTMGTRWSYLEDLFHAGIEESEAKQLGWKNAVVANALQIVTGLVRYCTDTPQPKAQSQELLDRVLDYIERNLSEDLSLRAVSKRFYVSESTITQTFRKKMGISFYRCVTQRRLVAAKAFIEKGFLLEAASSQAGFSDYSSFFRAFKQEYGISPQQYKRRYITREAHAWMPPVERLDRPLPEPPDASRLAPAEHD